MHAVEYYAMEPYNTMRNTMKDAVHIAIHASNKSTETASLLRPCQAAKPPESRPRPAASTACKPPFRILTTPPPFPRLFRAWTRRGARGKSIIINDAYRHKKKEGGRKKNI